MILIQAPPPFPNMFFRYGLLFRQVSSITKKSMSAIFIVQKIGKTDENAVLSGVAHFKNSNGVFMPV
jgi:hypothetical protein